MTPTIEDLSRPFDTEDGTIMGTPEFIAPEVLTAAGLTAEKCRRASERVKALERGTSSETTLVVGVSSAPTIIVRALASSATSVLRWLRATP